MSKALEYQMTTPCPECPFLKKHAKSYGLRRLREFASAEFPCHKTAANDEETGEETGDFVPTEGSQHCAGALIFLEKRGETYQMMQCLNSSKSQTYDCDSIHRY